MKLVAHIEEIDKKKWKTSFDPDTQGSWGATSKLKSKNKNLPQTKFDKKSVIGNIAHTYIEIVTMDIIDHINKAFKMFGYKTDMMPIPLERDWYLSADKQRDYIHLTTSSFNKPVVAANASETQLYRWELLQEKQSILNALISNHDTHSGNYVFDEKSQKSYAIDFGLSFSRPVGTNIDDLSRQIKLHAPQNKELQKLARAQKYLTFWQGFLEHNQKSFSHWIDNSTNKFLKKLETEVRKVQKEHKYSEIDLQELKQMVLDVMSEITETIEDNAEELLKDINRELSMINKRIKSKLSNKKLPSMTRQDKEKGNEE